MILAWDKKPVSRELTRGMRAINRVKRMMIDEHRLLYEDLAEVWASSPDEDYVVLTHKKDQVWQLWYRHPEDNWTLTSIHPDRDEAMKAAQASIEPEVPPGRYVIAQRPAGRKIKVLCTSESGVDVLSSIFTRLDYTVKVEDVA